MVEGRADFVHDLLSHAAGRIGVNTHMIQPRLCELAQVGTGSLDPLRVQFQFLT